MKRLSDYKDEAALDLWAELLEPMAEILADKTLKTIYKTEPKVYVVKHILTNHKNEAIQILKAIDDEEFTFLGLPLRLISLLQDIEKTPEFKDFFKFAEQVNVDGVISGSATANTEGGA